MLADPDIYWQYRIRLWSIQYDINPKISAVIWGRY